MSEKDSIQDLKYLLGTMGMEIFLAIGNGAKDFETIKIFSGTPISCIRGRIPILMELGLIKQEGYTYSLTNKGIKLYEKLK